MKQIETLNVKIFADGADKASMLEMYEKPFIKGLTTNPTLMKKAGITGRNVVSIGITNQRETTLIWNKKTGEVIHNAIVWQDRRTSDICKELRKNNHEEMITKITGLLLDPYFSATKVKWLLDQNEGIRVDCQNGDYLFGTVDTFLIWRLTDGQMHLTDATNASRTMLYDIRKGHWSKTI